MLSLSSASPLPQFTVLSHRLPKHGTTSGLGSQCATSPVLVLVLSQPACAGCVVLPTQGLKLPAGIFRPEPCQGPAFYLGVRKLFPLRRQASTPLPQTSVYTVP